MYLIFYFFWIYILANLNFLFSNRLNTVSFFIIAMKSINEASHRIFAISENMWNWEIRILNFKFGSKLENFATCFLNSGNLEHFWTLKFCMKLQNILNNWMVTCFKNQTIFWNLKNSVGRLIYIPLYMLIRYEE